jgi:hypothetical protein
MPRRLSRRHHVCTHMAIFAPPAIGAGAGGRAGGWYDDQRRSPRRPIRVV